MLTRLNGWAHHLQGLVHTQLCSHKPLEAPELHTFGQTKQMMHNSRQTRWRVEGQVGGSNPNKPPKGATKKAP